jgi:UDP-N-acetylglucosamine 2-epimerase (non-hydrolysing)
MKIISVVGARPNFMKIAPFIRALDRYNRKKAPVFEHRLVHTGQHYDDRMSEAFFGDLGIPEPDINLGIGSGTHAEQVGNTMIGFEKVLRKERPDWVVVVGDVNATLACSVTAKKENIRVCHIEAGLRSGDMTMPEEINRLVTDRLADLLFTPDRLSSENLRKEGVPDERIHFVGNIMIDTLDDQMERAGKLDLHKVIRDNLLSPDRAGSLQPVTIGEYAVMTLHRPSNVDHREVLEPLTRFLINEVSAELPLIWPIHPRARKHLESYSLWKKVLARKNILLLEPVGYREMLRLNKDARIMLTDSGGLQEECTVLGTPCLTLRWNTERPVTLREHGGASILVGTDIARLVKSYRKMRKARHVPFRPELWDGKTAGRIAKIMARFSENRKSR